MSYTSVTNSIQITEDQVNNTWYSGNENKDVFINANTISNFTNNGIILGGGGSRGNHGKNGLINSGTITRLINTGALLGGGGGSGGRINLGGSGGSGGGGGGRNSGGSLAFDLSGSNSSNGAGGGGPGGSGGKALDDGGSGGGGSGYGPFGGGGNAFASGGSNATINGGGNGANAFRTFETGYTGGGGGYGGGNGGIGGQGGYQNGNGQYGGDGGGGGGGGGAGGDAGGGYARGNVGFNGGYSICNNGTITNFINLQGGLISNAANNYPYGPLFYCGTAPTNYGILIQSTTRYGQLWCTGVTNTTGNMYISIADDSTLEIGTYSSVLKINASTVVLNNTSGYYDIYSWNLVSRGLYYDLVVTKTPYPCFKEGTKILTNTGYIPIENLRKGDLIKTLLSGYKAIDMIGKSEITNNSLSSRIPDQLYKCSQSQYPELFEDLILTGCHSILVKTFVSPEQREKTSKINGDIYVTEKKYRLPACIDEKSSVYDQKGTFIIYHIALENDDYYMNYGIYANGLLVESCSKRYLKEYSNMMLIE